MEVNNSPNFVIKKEKITALSRLQVFTEIVEIMAADRKAGTDISVPLLKVLTDLRPIAGLPTLNSIFETLIEVLFKFHYTQGNSERMAQVRIHEPKENIFCLYKEFAAIKKTNMEQYESFPDTLKRTTKGMLEFQQQLIQTHQQTLEQLENCALDLQGCDRKKADPQVVRLLLASRNKLLNLEDAHRRQLKTFSNKMERSVGVYIEQIVNKMKEKLIEIGERTQTWRYILQEIEDIDSFGIAQEIIGKLSCTYAFPSNLQDMCHSTMPAINRNTSCYVADTNPAAFNSHGYRKVIENYEVRTGRDLKLKEGDIVKAKVVDGDWAFGWKKARLGLKKVWGFFPMDVVARIIL